MTDKLKFCDNEITYFVRRVQSTKGKDDFFNLTKELYRDDDFWVPASTIDMEPMFSVKQNSLLKHGNIRSWVAYAQDERPVGRITAFYHRKRLEAKGGIGFFECIDNKKIAYALFDIAKDWLLSSGCCIINGPINFGEKDRYCGVLTEGFGTPGLHMENHNPDFYQKLFEGYGFDVEATIVTLKSSHTDIPYKKLSQLADKSAQTNGLRVRPFCYNNIDSQIKDIHDIYVQSFDREKRIDHLSADDIKHKFLELRPLIIDGLVQIAYVNKCPIGWVASNRDPNLFTNTLGGSRGIDPVNIRGMAMSVIPEYQGKGVATAIFDSLFSFLRSTFPEFSFYYAGVNSKTTKMIALAKSLNASAYKKHTVYKLEI